MAVWYNSCTDFLMHPNGPSLRHPKEAKEAIVYFTILSWVNCIIEPLSQLQHWTSAAFNLCPLSLYSSLHQSCNVEIFESFCPHLTWRHKGSSKTRGQGNPSRFWLLGPKFAACSRCHPLLWIGYSFSSKLQAATQYNGSTKEKKYFIAD